MRARYSSRRKVTAGIYHRSSILTISSSGGTKNALLPVRVHTSDGQQCDQRNSILRLCFLLHMPAEETFETEALWITYVCRDVQTTRISTCYHVSDRDVLFTSLFWTYLNRLIRIKQKMLSVYHPETDDSTIERANCTISQMLRSSIGPTQKDWVMCLPAIEFVLTPPDLNLQDTPHSF